MKVRDMLNKCKNADERYVLVYMMADGDVSRRFVGNEFNGWYVLDFEHDGISYTYSPRQGADGGGEWYVTPNTEVSGPGERSSHGSA